MLAVPRDWSDLTPSWMATALARRCPGVAVEGVDVEVVAEGTNVAARVHLSYRRGTGPASVFVKRTGRVRNRLALLAQGALDVEARLAHAGPVLPLAHPAPYAGAVDWPRLATVVVTDDVVAEGGRISGGVVPLSVDAVRDGLQGLARLHARYWDRPASGALSFLRPWRLGPVLSAVSRANLWRGIRRWADVGDPAVLPPCDAGSLARQFSQSAPLAAVGPQTLLHGDPYAGNTYTTPAGHLGFFDWQFAHTGNWSHDVGYFVVASLCVADRRRHERALLADYLRALQESGADAPGETEAWERYRATPAFGLAAWLHTLSFGGFQPTEVCEGAIRRFAAAYIDLETERSMVAAPGA